MLKVVEHDFNAEELKWAFPEVDPGAVPYGEKVLIQLRTPKKKSTGGIHLSEETREVEKWNTQVGKVIALGPLAFRKRDTLEPWQEGVWAQVGDFVRCPKYGGDRWEMAVPGRDEPALFIVCKDHELIARVTCHPLDMRAFI